MALVGKFHRLKPFLRRPGSPGARSVTSGAAERACAAFAQIENPYKEPEPGCTLCGMKVDYKNVQLLSQYVSPFTGQIYGRHLTGLCGIKQKEISKAVKKARCMGFMSVSHKHPQFFKDPVVCNVKQLQ